MILPAGSAMPTRTTMSSRNGGSVTAMPSRGKVVARMKGELVDANLETVAGEQRSIGPTVGVGHRRREQPSSSDYEEVQFDADARRGRPREVSST